MACHQLYGWWQIEKTAIFRRTLTKVKVGDHVVAALKGHRIGRLGQVIAMQIEDHEWAPLVPPSKRWPNGQMGRRIQVRWDLTCGPTDRDLIVYLPTGSQLSNAELLPTVAEIKSRSLEQIMAAMNEPANWVGLLGHFKYERALADYIAAYPHHLEDGLVPHPDAKIREKVFVDRRRLDVLLLDRDERPVIVECKQGAPTIANLEQIRDYMKSLRKETGRNDVRGILVHGGSRKLHSTVVAAAARKPRVEIVQYHLQVDFAGSAS